MTANDQIDSPLPPREGTPPSSDATKTMRIDIFPDLLGETLAKQKRASGQLPSLETSTIFPDEIHPVSRSEDYAKLLQSIYDGVLITDVRGRIIDFNARAVDFFLCDERELLGVSVVDLISGADDGLIQAVWRNLGNHKYTLIEALCRRRDRTTFPAEIAVNRVDIDAQGQLSFFVRDITVRRKAQEDLERAIARLEEHDRARAQFVANVSHELRTPLTSMIYAVANMLRGVVGPLPDRARQYLAMLDGDCKRLLSTVNDILDLRKLESRSLTLNRVQTSLEPLVRKAVEALKVQMDQKAQELLLLVSVGPSFVDCDAQKMERVVLNVVGNAVKFTPSGGRIQVTVEKDPDREGCARVSVCDNGIGIPADALDKVTQRYFTVGEQPSGSGLGLAISKEIVDLHGGRLRIVSPAPGANKGTAVYISLPLSDAPTVMVVDGSEAVRGGMAVMLRQRGYRVTEATDGSAALTHLGAGAPDVAVLDVSRLGMDIAQFLASLKPRDLLRRTGVIVVTGTALGRSTMEMLNAMLVATVSSPVEEGALLEQINKVLVRRATSMRRPLTGISRPDETGMMSGVAAPGVGN